MSRALLISTLFLAGVTAGSAVAQSTSPADAPIPAKKGPLAGLLEPWDGRGDEITPKAIHLGGIFQPWHDEDSAKPKHLAAGHTPRKEGRLGGLLQPWGDKSDDKPAAVAKADAPVGKKKGPLGGLLQPWDSAPDKP